MAKQYRVLRNIGSTDSAYAVGKVITGDGLDAARLARLVDQRYLVPLDDDPSGLTTEDVVSLRQMAKDYAALQKDVATSGDASESLKASNADAKKALDAADKELAALKKENATLKKDNERLTKALESSMSGAATGGEATGTAPPKS